MDTPKSLLHRARKASPALDHAIRAYGRYSEAGGGRLAASVTLPGFLSFFPLLAVAFLVLILVLHGSASAQQSVLDGVHDYIPGLLCSKTPGVHGYPCGTGKIDVGSIRAKSGTGVLSGVIGFVGLALAGTGWVNNLRTAIRTVWHQSQRAGNFLVKKLVDIGILVVLGVTLLAAVSIAGLASSATSSVLSLLGVGRGIVPKLIVIAIGIVLSVAVNVAIFLFLYTRLAQHSGPLRRVVRGSLLAGCLFEVLQLFGATYIAHTTGNPVYGIFAVIIGLVLWIGLVVQITLFCAAWTVTAPYLDDVAPSGTERPEPLPYPEGPAVGPMRAGGVGSAVAGPAEPPGSGAARVAGVAGVGLVAASAAGVAVYGIRTLRDTLRSDEVS